MSAFIHQASGPSALKRWLSAADDGDTDALSRMLDAGVDLEAADALGDTALVRAACGGHIDAVDLLLERGAHKGRLRALESAVAEGHVAVVERLLRACAPLDDTAAGPLLRLAVRQPNPSILDRLIQAGANPDTRHPSPVGLDTDNTVQRRPRNAIEEALDHRLWRAVCWLARRGASPDARDRHGRPALLLAAEIGTIEAIEELLAAGAPVDVRGPGGITPLMGAATRRSERAIEVLLAAGADITARDDDGCTALLYALESRRLRCVEALLEAGANADTRDNAGRSALSHAIGARFANGLRLLIEKDAELDAPDRAGATPLHRAAQARWADGVTMLLEAGANPTLRDALGRTPSECARSSGRSLPPIPERLARELRKAEVRWSLPHRQALGNASQAIQAI